MKHFAVGLFIVLGIVSCSKIFGGGGAKKACENMAKQCDADASSKEIDECASDISNAKDEIGADSYDKFLSCAGDAESCPEAMGCVMGVAMKGGMKALSNFQKGFDKASR